MKIRGWRVITYTNEFPRLGWVMKTYPVEFGNSSIRDKKARLDYIKELCNNEEVFSVKPII